MRVIVLAFSLASTCLHADRILVIGDSWASPVARQLDIVLHENGYTDSTADATPFKELTSQMSSPAGLVEISTWLGERPDVKFVQMSTGANDWGATKWTPAWAGTQEETLLFADIIKNVDIIVDHIISLRPDIQVLWSGYDFPRPTRNRLGDYVPPAEINAFLIRLAEQMANFALTKPGLSFVDLNGTLQIAFGFDGIQYTTFDPDHVIPPGDPSLPDARYPSPKEPFQFRDPWHLQPGGYKALAQAQFDGFYAPLLAGPDFHINAGLNDAWFDPATPGQGFFVTVFPDIGQLFLAWFTYDTERPPEDVQALLGEPGHRWLTAFGSYADNRAVLDIEVTKGGVFDASDPAPSQDLDGTIILEFSNCNAATVSYDIPSVDRQGVIPIERIALDNMPLCESLQTQ
jgi:hypothetical protein